METNNNQAVSVQAHQVAVNYFDAKQFETIQRVCKLFASSELVPDMYKISKQGENKAIANCVIAFEMAHRVGASPLMIMQNMVPIYGRPSWSASFLISTVNSCGRFKPLKYKFRELGMLGMIDLPGGKQLDGKKIMDIECIAYTSEKDSDDLLEGSPISIRLAVLEGWYQKNGSKWQTMPRQMLMYRAAAFWVRAYAPELSMGMRTTEEYQDIQDATYTEVKEDVENEITTQANTVEISLEEEAPQETPVATIPTDVEGQQPAQEIVDKETGEVIVVSEPVHEPVRDEEPTVRKAYTNAKPATNGAKQAHLPDF